MSLRISERDFGAGAICRALVDGLPEWFGMPESNAEYVRTADAGPVWLAVEDGEAVGLMILKPHGTAAVETYLLAVRRDRRGDGIGRRLIEAAERFAAAGGARFLTVKTLGPSHPSPEYAQTRGFYEALGFVPLEEFETIWGPENPCLFMVKPVG
jgi:GNAT superfamily N-acetyltransferase